MRNYVLLTLVTYVVAQPLPGQLVSAVDRPSLTPPIQTRAHQEFNPGADPDLNDPGSGFRTTLNQVSGYAGPADPENPSRPVICNPVVRRALDLAWSESSLAAHQPPFLTNDKVEFGFSIKLEKLAHRVSVSRVHTSYRSDGRPNALTISVDEETIATVHTHNLGVRPAPSLADLRMRLPSFVKSQFCLYVTIPGTDSYNSIDLNAVCGMAP